jgi:peptide/nickel transport system substrate-binding protein
MAGYWERITTTRLARRRALAGATSIGLGAAALALAGCGSGGKSSSSTASTAPTEQDKSGLLSFPQETTSQAKPGGTLKSFYGSTDPAGFDPHTSQTFTTLTAVCYYTYPRMMTYSPVKYPGFNKGEVEGDLAESYEISGDHLQLTFKLRQGLKWDNKPPVNGRVIDAQDVVANWKKFSTVGVRSGDLAYSEANPGSPVESVTAPDNNTVIVKMHSPDASILQLFASGVIFYVIPREGIEGGFDAKNQTIGYGPYLMDTFRPSTGFTWLKNPNYHQKGRPFPDKVEQPQILEYASRLAQFRAGNIWTSVATNEDMVPLKRDLPQLQLYEGSAFATAASQVSFGYEGDSPFKDQRVRQAAALAIDHDTVLDVIYGLDVFKKAQLTPTVRMHTLVPAAFDGYWLDPTDTKNFPGGFWYTKFDPAESKRLMAAAGFPNGVSTELNFTPNQYGAQYERTASALQDMFKNVGINASARPRDYQTDYIPNVYYSYQGARSNGFNGMIWRAELSYPTAAAGLYGNVHKDGGRYRGLTPTGLNAKQGDPYLNDAIVKAKQEFDAKKQQALIADIQRYAADKAYYLPVYGSFPAYTLIWPAIGNYGTLRSGPGGNTIVETVLSWWVDDRKPPLGKA